MSYIWYNPETKSYHVGSKVEYDMQLSTCKTPEEMMILYELDELTERIADKIVTELNAARTELRSA